ncbi:MULTISPECIES: hypothetical protein [Clostridium]|uniref:hypothetical protein n=1 Tax=Clostridium TaxID=1485 RepID=UPI0007732D5E|nr:MULTISPECIES: hypothetical protein [Clostridium]MBY6836272.1 hypothetical protein [Clostridium botulinum]MBY6931873.1 hypothetical protein [Clostridium botulinum]NFG20561.1 hypothetical protein [Clostridium botulinum]NFG63666.1 hypothetical protein [Clostridium botulinum]NFO05294.1 hypothetical protein [Clostridium botulinum]
MNNSKIRLRLSNPKEVRKTLARIANMVINNEIDSKRANNITYICNSILQSIRTDELEKQLQQLEERINND